MKMYRIHDVKSGQYHLPFYAHNHGAAIREIENAMKQGGSPLSNNPEDFYIFHVGDVEDDTPELKPAMPECIIKCLEIAQRGDN